MKQVKIPKEITGHRDSWLWKPVYRRLHVYNKMFSGCWVGMPGSGKSFGALSLCYLLDRGSNGEPRFDVSRVCFSAREFAELVSQDLPRGTSIIIDDAGLSLYSREAMTKVVRQISKVFQSVRYKNLLIFLTLPTLGSLDKGVREILNCYFEPLEINFEYEKTRVKYHRLQTNPKSGKIYSHRPTRLEYGVYADGYPKKVVKMINSIWIDKPPEFLIAAYEARKKAYLDEWNKRNLKIICESEDGKKKERKENLFVKYYNLVNADRESFDSGVEDQLHVDSAKIMLRFKGCSPHAADQVARAINRELKAQRRAQQAL